MPPLPAARTRILDAVASDDYLSVLGTCSVTYEGRAASVLDDADRHVVRKPDGTLLVHDPSGRQPSAWLGPDAALDVRLASDPAEGDRGPAGDSDDAPDSDGDPVDAALVLAATRDDEELTVRFRSVAAVSAMDAAPAPAVEVSGTEADLRQRVLDAPELVEPGFEALATERETSAGPIDVYGTDRDGRAVAVELKRRRAGPRAVTQLERYVDALDRDTHADATARGVLVAPSITDRARRMLTEKGLTFVSLTPDV